MMSQPPNGFFVNDMLVFGDPPKWVSKGYTVDVPDRSHSGDNFNEFFETAVRGMIGALGNDLRMQVCWSVNSDYQKALIDYGRESKVIPENSETLAWALQSRLERGSRYWNGMKNRTLRREKLRIYFSKQITAKTPMSLSTAKLRDFYRKLFSEYKNEFDIIGSSMSNRFGPIGARFVPMSDVEHYSHIAEFLNPSYADRFGFDNKATFDKWASIQENCLHSGIKDGLEHRPGYGFHFDGYYHNILVLKRLPDTTHETTILDLVKTSMMDYAITVNLYPKDPDKAVREEQSILDRLKGDYVDTQKEEFVTAIELRKTRINAIKKGSIKPLDADFIIRVWARTPEDLAMRTEVLKTVITRMSGANYHQPIIFEATKKLFFQSWPGWTYGSYTAHSKYYEDIDLARLLPISSSFNGHLKNADALYDGPNGSLAGIKLFVNGQPQHAALFGMSGSGKSAFMFDLLSQTRHFFDYLVLIEEGGSYLPLVEVMKGRSIILHPDGDLTINYLDTHGLPLTSEQIDAASTIASRMTGAITDPEKRALRKATMTSYISMLYTRTFEDWAKFKPQKVVEITRLAIVVLALQKEMQNHVDKDTTYLEAWTYARDNEAELNIPAKMAAVPDGEVSLFLKNHETEHIVRNTAFAFMSPEEMPTHSALWETMKNTPMAEDDKRQIQDIAKLLGAWTVSDGSHGKLFDGITNIRLNSPVVHFELGKLPDGSDMKELAGFLISNYVRQHIITLPRSKKKGVVFEEVAKFLSIPGGHEIVSEFYAQMRKFSAWVISIVQVYNQFKNSPIRGIIMTLSKQFYLMRQNDRRDLEDLCRDLELSEATRTAILNYPMPEHVDYAYSQLTYYHMDNIQPICGTITVKLSPEVIRAEKEFWNNRKQDVQANRLAMSQALDDKFNTVSKAVEIKTLAGAVS